MSCSTSAHQIQDKLSVGAGVACLTSNSQVLETDPARYFITGNEEADRLIAECNRNLEQAYRKALKEGRKNIAEFILPRLRGDDISTEDLIKGRRLLFNLKEIDKARERAEKRINQYLEHGIQPGPFLQEEINEPVAHKTRMAQQVLEQELKGFPYAQAMKQACIDYGINSSEFKTAAANFKEMLDAVRPPHPDRFANEQEAADWLNRHAEFSKVFPWQRWDDHQGDAYYTAVITSEPRSIDHVAGLMRYITSGPLAMFGEEASLMQVLPDENDSNVSRVSTYFSDYTKSRRDDIGVAMNENMWFMLKEGTPVRKTDRSGPGTAGTRKYEGLGCEFWVLFN